MAKYKCPYCPDGFAHTSGPIPNPNEWLLISDIAFEDFFKEEVIVERFTKQDDTSF